MDQKLVHSSSVPLLRGAASLVSVGASGRALAPNVGRATFLARFGPRRSTLGELLAAACTGEATA